MPRYWTQTSLRSWIFVQAGIVLALLLAVLFYLSREALDRSTDEILAERLLLAEHTARRLDFVLQQSLLRMERYASPDLILSGDSESIASGLRRLYEELPLTPAHVAVTDKEGRVLHTWPGLSPPEEVARYPFSAGWAGSAITGLLPDLWDQGEVVYLASPIRNEAASPQGLVLAVIDPAGHAFSDFLQPFSVGSTGYAEVVDRGGLILANTRGVGLFLKADHADRFAQLIDQGKTTMGTCHRCHEAPDRQREDEVMAFAPLQRAPWGIAIRQSEDEALDPVRDLERRFLILGLVCLAAVVVLSWSISRRFVRSAHQLQARASRIAQGDLSTPVAPVAGAEMIRLADALERMRQEILAARQKDEQYERELEETVVARTRELMSVVRASETLVSAAGPEALLDAVVETAADTFGADGAILFLSDAQSGSLVAGAATGYDLQALSAVALGPGEGGRTFQRGEPILSNDPTEVEELLSDLSGENRRCLLEAGGNRDLRAFVCVPLETKGQVLGSLLLASFREGVAFSSSSVGLAQTFARLACALLENFRLLREASQADALRQADRLKTEFLSNISHELQTPLASLRASLDFLPRALLSKGGRESGAMLVQNAKRSAERLQRLISDLIEVTRLQNLQLQLQSEPLDLRELVQRVGKDFLPLLAEKGQALHLVLSGGPVVVLGDERRLEQVLNNLMMNAHQYTPPSGHITVTVREEGDQALVSVADTGPGLSAEQKERLFQRFYRGPGRAPSGLGLGLAIAKGLVELHGGKIWVESEPGLGSTFRFSLTRAAADEDPHY